MRRHHPAFRLGTAELVRKHLEFLPTQECLVGFVLKNHAGGDSWKNIFVFLNGNREAREVTLPAGNYETIVCDGVINEQGLGEEHGGTIMVDGQSALILREKD